MSVLLPSYRTGGEWFDTLTGNHGAVIDAVMLQSGPVVLQLVQYHDGGDVVAVTGHERVGNVHLSIDVDDIDAKHATVTAAGGLDVTPIVDLPFPGARSFYVRDPDGVPVEFIHLPTP
jgi:catechol 2,3-dioxygenase-like lactoylglutathione lyase family enzyme